MIEARVLDLADRLRAIKEDKVLPLSLIHILSQQDGLIPQLFQKMGAEPGNLAAAFAKKVGELPHVTGTGRDPEKVYITPELDRALTAAEKSAAAMKDEYVSVEHLVLGMMDAPNAAVKEVLRQFSLDKTRFLEVLAQVRGNQRAVSYTHLDVYKRQLIGCAERAVRRSAVPLFLRSFRREVCDAGKSRCV